MGGAGYIFTGAHDANVMHNSATINLNIVEACWRRRANRIFYLRRRAFTRPMTRKTRTTRTAPRTALIPLLRIRSTDGRSCSASGSTAPMRATTQWKSESRATTTSSVRKAPGTAVARRRRQRCVAKWRCSRPAERSRSGDRARRRRSFLYINECIEGTTRLMRSNFSQPVNIGSEALGADHVINYRTERFEGVVRKLTAKKGVDVAFEHVGPDTFNGSCSSSNTASSARSASPCATSARAWRRWRPVCCR